MIDRIRHVAVIAPAGPLAADRFERGQRFLQQSGIEVSVMPHVFAGNGESYLSAAAEQRAADFRAAWNDFEVDAIWCARGGFGCAHVLERIDWEALPPRPELPVIGYSDVTLLHMAMLRYRRGMPVAAPMLGKLAEAHEDEWCRRYLDAALAGTPVAVDTALTVYRAGMVEAPVIAANLAVLTTLAGTRYWPDFTGRILIVEDLNEPLYKLDRYLTQLGMLGVWNEVAGVVFGQFLDCAEPEELELLFWRFAREWDFPVAAGLPFGHDWPTLSLNLTKKVKITQNHMDINR